MRLFIYVGTYETLDFAKESLAEFPGSIICPCPRGFMVMKPADGNETPIKPAPVATPPAKAAPAPATKKPSTIRRDKPAA